MTTPTPSEEIDAIVAKHGGWKGDLVVHLRSVVMATDPDITEQTKWKMPSLPEGRPVWELNGMLCFIEIWKTNIKLLFPKGAHLRDPNKLFNARLKSADIRAIEFHDGDKVDEAGLTELVREAVKTNRSN